MAPTDPLTPAEIAALIQRENHPSRLSVEELDGLTSSLSTEELEEVVTLLGLPRFTEQLPVLIERVLLVSARLRRDPPAYEGPVEHIVREFERWGIDRQSEPGAQSSPPSSPSSPSSTPHPVTPLRPTSTPQTQTPSASYIVQSPSKTTHVLSWFEAASLARAVPGSTARRAAGSSRARKAPAKAYAVFYGGQVGSFERWDHVQRLITGHGLAIYAGFPSLAAAEAAVTYARGKGWTADSVNDDRDHGASALSSSPLPLPSSYDDNPLNSASSNSLWYAVCRGVVPGVYCSWLECSLNTTGVKGNLCNSFPTRAAAEEAFTSAFRGGQTRAISRIG